MCVISSCLIFYEFKKKLELKLKYYFKYFSNKDLEKLEGIFSDDVQLIDLENHNMFVVVDKKFIKNFVIDNRIIGYRNDG